MEVDNHMPWFAVKCAFSQIQSEFDCDDTRDRDFTPECVKCSFGYVRGFYYDESAETINLIIKIPNGGFRYESIWNVNEEDAYLCAQKIINREFTFTMNRHHPLYVGEKVYDNNAELICEVVEINGQNVVVSQEKYVEENKKMFDLDCEKEPMKWVADADELYQFADGITDRREGNPVCYEHTSIDYPFFSPYLYENLYTFEVDGLSNEERERLLSQERDTEDDGSQVKITMIADKKNLAQHLRDLADSLDENIEHYETAKFDAEIDWEYE